MIRKKVHKRELVEDAPVKHGKHMRAMDVDVSRSALNQEYQRMIEEMQISTQKRIEESKAEHQKKIEEQLAAMALAQKSVQLQHSKVEERLAAIVSEQHPAQSRQQMTFSDEVKTSAPAKPDYSNLKYFNCGKMDHSAKICKLPQKPMPTVPDRNCFHCHQTGHFRQNYPMLASKSGDGADTRSSTNTCKKIEYTKTRDAYIELVIAGRMCSCLLDTGSDVRCFLILLFADCLSINV